ncbi:MAG: 6-carboxytetrahydropterin synthase QueD [Coriobacteriales bacterium]|jgi:queuosine biosynthesis protein QueD|nr:6-carboxytetrahydropterin synthase QueD [Coriobacteriales bacterium]
MTAIARALLHTDGGSRGNPGPSGIGFTLRVDDGRELLTLCRGGAYIGKTTNNVAEYRALIWGLENAQALAVRAIDIHADSELLVKQLRGEYRVKNEGIKPLFAEAKQLLTGFKSHSIKHVYREENAAADELANQAMDAHAQVGDAPVPYAAHNLFTQKIQESEEATMTTKTISEGSYTLTVKDHFDAAHALVGYPGQCRDLHGHTWDIEVSVRGTKLDEVGIVYDFKDIKANLKVITDQYDHKYLNDVPPFDTINATAEHLARVIYEQLAALLPEHIELVEVAVWESPQAKLVYKRS